MMKVMGVGGGSGGHVTPAIAIFEELAKQDPEIKIVFVADRHFYAQAQKLLTHSSMPIKVYSVFAGKLRRYHHLSKFRQFLDIPTVFKNVRDILYLFVGVIQSIFLIIRERPSVIFAKGGFVSVPVGVAAAFLRIPMVIHDSDARPGLANRIIARWATYIGTGNPLENYTYPQSKARYVGVPVNATLTPPDRKQQRAFKDKLGLHDLNKPLLVVTGGGLGSKNLNKLIAEIAPEILDRIAVFVISGSNNYQVALKQAPNHIDYILKPFVSKDMDQVLGAADIVLCRAGTTTLQELTALGKATIVVPAPQLADQAVNAEMYKKEDAIILLPESMILHSPNLLKKTILHLLDNPKQREALGVRFHAFAKPNAAKDMAKLIIDAAKKEK